MNDKREKIYAKEKDYFNIYSNYFINYFSFFNSTYKTVAAVVNKEIYKNSNCKIEFKVNSEWETGFEAQIIISNIGDNIIKDWKVGFEFPYEISTIWDGKIASHKNNNYVIQYLQYNNEIKPNGKVIIGFNGKRSDQSKIQIPSNCTLIVQDKEPEINQGNQNNTSENQGAQDSSDEFDYFSASYKITSQWENSYNLEVTIENKGKNKIDNWKLSFDSEDVINNIWNGKIESNDLKHYVIKNDGWNQDIAPGKKVKFGYTATYKNSVHLPENFEMNMVCKEVSNKDYSVNYIPIDTDSGKIIIKNISDNVIEDWKLFLPNHIKIKKIWDAKVVSEDKNYVYIDNAGYNADIQPGNSVEFGFNHSGINTDLTDFHLYQMVLYNMNDFIVDSDSDGITDQDEVNIYRTDPQKADTDSDGLNDYFELIISNTDPLKSESIESGIKDKDVDLDGDGLTNLEEYTLGTNPLLEDSDEDGLTDGEEVNKYKTDPLQFDTDGDELSDYDEIVLKLNPIIKDTGNTGILDGDKVIEQTIKHKIDQGKGISYINVTFKSKGNIAETTYIDEVYDTSNASSHKALLGVPIEIETTSEVIGEAIISFEIDDSILSAVNQKNLSFALYDDNKNKFKILDSVVNRKDNKITVTVKSFGQLCLINKEKLSANEAKKGYLTIPAHAKKVKKISKDKLETKLIELVKKDLGKTALIRTYSPQKALGLIFKYDLNITTVSKQVKIPKAFVQAILLREITCIYAEDAAADIAVINYFYNQEQREIYMKAPWYMKATMKIDIRLPMVRDSSTGLGQIFAKTAINANNNAIERKEATGIIYSKSKWKDMRVDCQGKLTHFFIEI